MHKTKTNNPDDIIIISLKNFYELSLAKILRLHSFQKSHSLFLHFVAPEDSFSW